MTEWHSSMSCTPALERPSLAAAISRAGRIGSPFTHYGATGTLPPSQHMSQYSGNVRTTLAGTENGCLQQQCHGRGMVPRRLHGCNLQPGQQRDGVVCSRETGAAAHLKQLAKLCPWMKLISHSNQSLCRAPGGCAGRPLVIREGRVLGPHRQLSGQPVG